MVSFAVAVVSGVAGWRSVPGGLGVLEGLWGVGRGRFVVVIGWM